MRSEYLISLPRDLNSLAQILLRLSMPAFAGPLCHCYCLCPSPRIGLACLAKHFGLKRGVPGFNYSKREDAVTGAASSRPPPLKLPWIPRFKKFEDWAQGDGRICEGSLIMSCYSARNNLNYAG